MKVMEQLESKFVYYNVATQLFSQYAMGELPDIISTSCAFIIIIVIILNVSIYYGITGVDYADDITLLANTPALLHRLEQVADSPPCPRRQN